MMPIRITEGTRAIAMAAPFVPDPVLHCLISYSKPPYEGDIIITLTLEMKKLRLREIKYFE